MNPFGWTFRAQFAAGAIGCAVLLAYALFVQYQLKIEPCPLCIFQRVAFMAMGIFFLLGALHGPRATGRKVYAALVVVSGLVGASISARHVWLQHLPKDQIPDCGPGLAYMIDAFPMAQMFKMVLTGSGECAEVNWTFLGIAMPAWTLFCFLILIGWAIWSALNRIHPAAR
ncbi:MAG: disulfide bond formation protein B [Tahibacter sp.]